MVVEFAPYGNLRQFLRDRRPFEYPQSRPSSRGPSLTIRDFVFFALQIARGMEYLGNRKVSLYFRRFEPNKNPLKGKTSHLWPPNFKKNTPYVKPMKATLRPILLYELQ